MDSHSTLVAATAALILWSVTKPNCDLATPLHDSFTISEWSLWICTTHCKLHGCWTMAVIKETMQTIFVLGLIHGSVLYKGFCPHLNSWSTWLKLLFVYEATLKVTVKTKKCASNTVISSDTRCLFVTLLVAAVHLVPEHKRGHDYTWETLLGDVMFKADLMKICKHADTQTNCKYRFVSGLDKLLRPFLTLLGENDVTMLKLCPEAHSLS